MKKILIFIGCLILLAAVLSIINESNSSNNTNDRNPTAIEIEHKFSQNQDEISKKSSIINQEDVLSVKVQKLEPTDYNTAANAYNAMTLIVSVENKSNKDIDGFTGKLEIYDIFGEKINTFEIKQDETLKVGEKEDFFFTYNINLFAKGRNKLFNLTKWTDKFILDKVLYLEDVNNK